MRGIHWLSLGLLTLGIAAGARYLLERERAGGLRAEIEFLRQETRRASELRAEHERLLSARVSDAELLRLRDDRAALMRLRAEINQLEQTAERRARMLELVKAAQVPPIVLKLGLAKDGALLLDGDPASEEGIRQVFTQLAKRAERVEIRLRFDHREVPGPLFKQRIEEIARWQKESGLRPTLRFDQAEPGPAK
jgi:hypothetical protein